MLPAMLLCSYWKLGSDAQAMGGTIRINDRTVRRALIVIALGGLAIGLVAMLAGRSGFARWAWITAATPVIAALALSIIRDLRAGRMGVDLLALLSMAAALALDETLAGAIVAVMYAGGQALEDFAVGRAERDLKALIDRAPRLAHRKRGDALEDVPIDQIAVGNAVLVRAGEVVPIDGQVASPSALIDESVLTGEPIPVMRQAGEAISSGTINVGETFEMRATATAGDSAYAGIVRMVTAAQTAKAPFIRMADRYALLLLPVTLCIAGAAWWLSGDADPRARGARCGDALSVDPCCAGGFHRRNLASGAPRHPCQGRRPARDARAHPHRDVRQDRDFDGWRRPPRRRRDRSWRGAR